MCLQLFQSFDSVIANANENEQNRKKWKERDRMNMCAFDTPATLLKLYPSANGMT